MNRYWPPHAVLEGRYQVRVPVGRDPGDVLNEHNHRFHGRDEARSIEEQFSSAVVTPMAVLTAERLAGRTDDHQIQSRTAEALVAHTNRIE